MARLVYDHDIAPVLAAAERWINTCLIYDTSLFSQTALWTGEAVDEVYHAFVEHPDFGKDDFITKLKGQMRPASPAATEPEYLAGRVVEITRGDEIVHRVPLQKPWVKR